MVNVSAEFRERMSNPSAYPQRIAFQFNNGTIISNEDIDVQGGVDFHEVFCSETDYTIGLTPSSEISFGLFNEDGHYNNFSFGEFRAYIGVMMSEETNSSTPVKRPAISISGNTMTVSGNGKLQTFELCPMGVFIAPRPAVVQKTLIDIRANDRMTLFDKNLPSFESMGYVDHVQARTLFQKICQLAGVTPIGDYFLNSDLMFDMEHAPEDGAHTLRDALGWIAQISGANARMNREGQLVLKYAFTSTDKTYDESTYTSFEPYWYTTPTVTGLHVRNGNSTAETVYGTSGENNFLIQDNPFLRIDDPDEDEIPEEEVSGG